MASLAVREGNGSLVWAFARMVIRLFQAAIFRRSPSQILETFCFIFIQFYLHYSFIFMARLCNIRRKCAEDQVESRLKPEKKEPRSRTLGELSRTKHS
jgi:hypothetical protein